MILLRGSQHGMRIVTACRDLPDVVDVASVVKGFVGVDRHVRTPVYVDLSYDVDDVKDSLQALFQYIPMMIRPESTRAAYCWV